MKFSSSLKFNAVSDWWDEYIAYDTLKRHVYQLERQQAGYRDTVHDLEANESSSLMRHHDTAIPTDALFTPLLDRELKKITLFYEAQEKELLDEVYTLSSLVQQQEDFGPDVGHQYENQDGFEDDDDDEDDEDFNPMMMNSELTLSRSPVNRRRRSLSESNGLRGGLSQGGSVRGPGLSHTRRYSLSSNEDHADLEASIASLRSSGAIDPANTLIASSTQGRAASRSPIRAARTIASKMFARDSQVPETVWTAKNNYAMDIQLLFKRRITNIYLSLTALRSYVELNLTGFRKILKKYDKVTDSDLRDNYLHDVVEQATPFTNTSKDKLNRAIDNLMELYARCVTKGDVTAARRQLKMHQREHIAWERDTVWRQMIGQARRGEGESIRALGGTLLLEPEAGLLNVQTPAGRFKLTWRQIHLLIALIVFVVLLNVKTISAVEANRCFAILAFATIMWATEAIPLFVTSMFVPLLLVTLRVIIVDDKRLSTPDATKWVFSMMFSPTIMLLIGGFTIAAALSKTNIDRVLITRVLSMAGTKPSTVLLAFMGVACFASMWISNVAAPTLCFTLIKPILRTLPPRSSFAPCLILGIALAANIGGQSSPISSPQNLIAMEKMDPKLAWTKWFAVALPVSAISIVLIWLLLLVSYKPSRSPDGESELEIKPIRPTKEPFTLKQWWVCFVCLATITLWCFEHALERWVGDMGVIAIVPIVLFFSTGVLKKDDFDQFLWTVVFLAMGGIALGKGVTSSGLLDVLDDIIRDIIDGKAVYTVVLVLSGIVLVVSTFISHTIASVLLVPIAKEVGSKLPGHPETLLIFLTALVCSAGMGMPVSGFPNQTAATQEDDMGQLYLSNIDFLKNGVPASIIATMVVATVGYLLMTVVV